MTSPASSSAPSHVAPSHIVVIGAGIVGVATAYELALRGASVTLLERREGAGLETSRANGGQLSACEVAPWAGPEVPGLILKWMGRDDAPFRLRLKPDPEQWLWLMRFLSRCRASARAERVLPNLQLALLTRARLDAYRAAFAGRGETFDMDHAQNGILRVFRDRHGLAEAREGMARMDAAGVEQRELSPTDCVALEPALAAAFQKDEIAGGIYCPSDGMGDAHLFCRELAAAAESLGVRFRAGEEVEAIEVHDGKTTGVRLADELVAADAVVVAAGPMTARLLRPLGVRLPVYPVKGYSVTLPLEEEAGPMAPNVSVTDEARKVVVSRLGNRLRAAGQAEIGGYDLTLEMPRARSVFQALTGLMPQMNPLEARAEYWCGLRPMSPDGSPVIGELAARSGPIQGLFVNGGHGTLGWTMGAGSAAALADLICGSAPQLDLTPFSHKRFSF
ncbi:D-amino-acid dehydrogenase [Parvibaculum indicum]|uniref:D-amino acid dehydrogenase n=1 Tax=Parvibaculum indicum TaxID=562969 RepID=UPI00141F2CBD|nr:D-amino-acid dehydrogenase [Parvibaculum indicum]